MKIAPVLLTVSFGLLLHPLTSSAAEAEPLPPGPSETATTFLRRLEKAEIDEAVKLWAGKAVNERLRTRTEQMAAKIRRLGGIQTLKTPNVEKRQKNLESHQVVVIVVYGTRDLAFGSFSFVQDKGVWKISNLRSERGWGGTTSLFEDEPDPEHPTTVPAE
jgi:hypothetical protein